MDNFKEDLESTIRKELRESSLVDLIKQEIFRARELQKKDFIYFNQIYLFVYSQNMETMFINVPDITEEMKTYLLLKQTNANYKNILSKRYK
jgi:hypothetical protein